MSQHSPWLTVNRGEAPLLVSIPHTGINVPKPYATNFVSIDRARKDADWWIDLLYDFASGLGATVVHTSISRTVIDVNRDPSGASLYPGQATTELCPTTTFDGEPLYQPGREPDEAEIAVRRAAYFEPYHAALATEIERLRAGHDKLVLYDCHSIRSVVPRLFDGVLPQFSIGTNSGASCEAALTASVERLCHNTGLTWVTNGRFKGGHITRRFGSPDSGVHAIQMELACRGYMHEALGPVSDAEWPTPYDPDFAAPMKATLTRIFEAALAFARQ